MTKQQKTIIGLLTVGVLCVFSTLCLVLVATTNRTSESVTVADANRPATPTRKPTPTSTITPSPTATPVPLSYDELLSKVNGMTSLQRQNYASSLKGTRVHWRASVVEVYPDGKALLDVYKDTSQHHIDWGQTITEIMGYHVYLQNVPQNVALNLKKGQEIEFDAIIADASISGGLSIYLNFISFSSLPVPTDTPRPKNVTPVPLTYQQIRTQYSKLSDSEKEGFFQSLIGKRVRWKGEILGIEKVAAGGRVNLFLSGQGQGLFDTVTLIVPPELVTKIKENQVIEFTADIYDADDIVGFSISMDFVSF
jgi:hypothetical protein